MSWLYGKRFLTCFCVILSISHSGLSLMSSAIFQFIGKRRRTRASRKLPVAAYRRNLQRRLLQQLLEQQNVIDHIPLDDGISGDEDDDLHHSDHHYSLAAMDGSTADGGSDEETCSICLDDFMTGVDVKVTNDMSEPCGRLCGYEWLTELVFDDDNSVGAPLSALLPRALHRAVARAPEQLLSALQAGRDLDGPGRAAQAHLRLHDSARRADPTARTREYCAQ